MLLMSFSVTALDIWALVFTVYLLLLPKHCFYRPCGKAYGDYNVNLIM